MSRSVFALTSIVGCFLLVATSASAADVQTITHGREVDLEDHLVAGKYVLFDFYADWCGPCKALDPQLRSLADRHRDQLALRKVDVINWDSAVARQYRLSSIPFLVLYGPDGTRLAEGDAGSVLRRLQSGLGNGGGYSPTTDSRSSIVPLLLVAAVLVISVGLVTRKRRSTPAATRHGSATASLPPTDTAADPGDPAIWFTVIQGSLEGPCTRGQLAELVRRKHLEPNAAVRRRGDVDWRTLDEILN